MSTPSRLAHVISRGLPAAVLAVRAARRRVERLSRTHPLATPPELLSLARRELARAEPEIARAITNAAISGWLLAARQPARDAAPMPLDPERTRDVLDAMAEMVPLLAPVPTHDTSDTRPVVQFPGIHAAAQELLAREVVTPTQLQLLAADATTAAESVAASVTSSGVGAVRAALADSVAKGGTLRDFRKAVGPLLEAAGFTSAHIETTYRTQVGQAQAAGLRAVLDHPLVGDEFPFVLYVATMGERTRPQHAYLAANGLDGTGVYWRDDPVILKFWPPCGWSCRCVAIPLSVEDAASYGVRAAKTWLTTGKEPAHRFVTAPPFDLPKNWPAQTGRVASVLAS